MINSHFSPTSDVSQARFLTRCLTSITRISQPRRKGWPLTAAEKGDCRGSLQCKHNPGLSKKPIHTTPWKSDTAARVPVNSAPQLQPGSRPNIFCQPLQNEPRDLPALVPARQRQCETRCGKIQTPMAPMFSYVSKDWSSPPSPPPVSLISKFSETVF